VAALKVQPCHQLIRVTEMINGEEVVGEIDNNIGLVTEFDVDNYRNAYLLRYPLTCENHFRLIDYDFRIGPHALRF